ncbi:cytochrome c [Yoonia sp.]|uniref:c-type cytochrome n=1 Tax=Yoonia sp. TaxID=2212373 RepID=UPI001A0721F1|nr:cytochrome c [Yoonia sp.]MBE0413454.1 cytochrome c [Yoonia sp.]
MKKRHFATSLGLAVILTGTAFAAGHISEDVTKAMEARQAHMTLYSFNMATLGGMAQDRTPYDAAAATAAANNLAAIANMDQSAYWVEGSDSSVEGSRAKAEIWSNADDYAEKIAALASASTALAAVAGNDLDALKGAFGPVGGSCAACHRAYRVSDN